MLLFTYLAVSNTGIASSSTFSTIANSPENRGVSSGTDVNISPSESSNTPSSIDITTSANGQANTNAPSRSTEVTSTVNDQASTDVSGNIDITASAGATTSMDASSGINISIRDNIHNITFKTMTSITAMSTTAKPTTMIEVITTSPSPIAQDCSYISNQGIATNYGIYRIQPSNDSESFEVVCDLETNGTEWIIFQRRFDGSEDFYLPWEDYKNGFGDLTGEHWLGLEKLHRLTTNGVWQLRVDLEDFSGNTAFAEYSNFAIGDASTNYRLSIGAFFGTAGDSLGWNANMAFSSYNQDHDTYEEYDGSCAVAWSGAWWYASCGASNLNGLYLGASKNDKTGMVWWMWKSDYEVLKKSEMKIRPIW